MSTRLIAGAMSGTSADGVDVAIVAIDGRGLEMTARLVGHHHEPYAVELRKAIFAIRERGSAALSELARCAREISLSYASAVGAALAGANLDSSELTAIAAHGQTLFHEPPNTIQWIDPALLAHKAGCQVISDFRRADCAAGGQGAPLVPFADYLLFRHPTFHRVLLNIGGIANITILPAGASIDQLIAFDTGPGNCISDWICRTYGSGGAECDLGGAGASRGRMLQEVKDQSLVDPYFTSPPPKSTDGPAMVQIFQKALGKSRPTINDLLATAAYLTGATIGAAVTSQVPANHPIEVIASGGGIHNKAMMGQLALMLPPNSVVRTTQDLGIPPEAKEAIAFALIGAATLDGVPANVPSCTGASRAVVLGSITP
jgi:anhydro-N-acetylmuramic acid kinase